jgi:hypothetical protein
LYDASHFLSEVYIDVAERQMLRGGHAIFRFTDDFRIATSSWAEARRSLEALDRSVRELGLILNEAKTYVPTIHRYEAMLGEGDALWRRVTAQVEADLSTFNWYSGEISTSDDSEDDPSGEFAVSAALRGLELWAAQIIEPSQTQSDVEQLPSRRLLGLALAPLMRHRSPGGLAYVGRILAYEPDLAPSIGRYLARLVAEFEDDVVVVLDEILVEVQLLSSWQSLWLLEPLLRIASFPSSLEHWVQSLLKSDLGPVRARAALILASSARIRVRELLEIYRSVPHASRPDVVAALATRASPRSRPLAGIIRESPLNRWVAEDVWEEGL